MMAGSAASHDRVERYAMAGHVDGVMFASMHGADPLPGTLARLGIPVVCSGRPMAPTEPPVPYVDVDHFGGVAAAVRHLVAHRPPPDRHHRRPAGHGRRHRPAGRLPGRARRRPGCRQQVAVGDFTRESGIRAMRALLADDPRLDAVFVASDMMAHGALQALQGRRPAGARPTSR